MPLEIAELRLRGFTSSHLHIFMWESINSSGNGGVGLGYYFPFEPELIIHTEMRRGSRDLDTDDSVGGLWSLADPS